MLEQLCIKNIAIIDSVEIDFSNGLNILSGETGAGKSIIIGSINFVLGGKSSRDIIRSNCDTAQVTALFSINNENVCNEIRDIGINIDDDMSILILRSINKSGKTTSKINGSTVNISILKKVSRFLIDIHGQHEHQSLLLPLKHIQLLDKFCGGQLETELITLSSFFKEYKAIEKSIQLISYDENERNQKIELLEFQIREIEEAELKEGEDDILTEQRKILSSTEKIADYISSVLDLLHESSQNDLSASDRISKSISQLAAICSIDSSLSNTLDSLVSIQAELEDIIFTCNRYADNIEHDPNALFNIENRLDLIYGLKRKYGNSINDILNHHEKIKNQLEYIKNSERELINLNTQKAEIEQKISKSCEIITNIRKKSASIIEKQIENAIRDLGMSNAEFKIKIKKRTQFSASGWDNVEFLISPNLGEALKPLVKIASGGEMSRIMLAIKTALADKDTIESFIFDEIDTGVSGHTAHQVAEKMAMIGKNHQILCITHLPQIVAMADTHFLIEKKSDDYKTTTSIIKLSEDQSINELSRLLGGAKITNSTIAAAKEMKEFAKNKNSEAK